MLHPSTKILLISIVLYHVLGVFQFPDFLGGKFPIRNLWWAYTKRAFEALCWTTVEIRGFRFVQYKSNQWQAPGFIRTTTSNGRQLLLLLHFLLQLLLLLRSLSKTLTAHLPTRYHLTSPLSLSFLGESFISTVTFTWIRCGRSSFLVYPMTWKRENSRTFWDGCQVMRLLKWTPKANIPWVSLSSPLLSLQLLRKTPFRS